MEVFDILLDEDYDIQIADGDFVVGESTQQHQMLLLLSEAGEWKQNPTVGVGLRSYLLDDTTVSDLKSAIAKGFEADGQRITSLKITPDYKLTIKAEYNG